ncbi:MAG TPA: zinc-binding dehydrogenase [Solirubrobacterales bacterium]
MRAAVLHELGGVPRYGEFDDPVGRADGVVVDVTLAALNPVDIAISTGLMRPVQPPAVMGEEGVGAYDGRRVYFQTCLKPFGSFAERTLVDPETLIDVPDDVDDGQALCLGIAGMAAWNALEWSGRLKQGESVLVLGASGVVGQLTVQAAKILGASRVVAAARDEGMLARCRELGADATVHLAGTQEEIAERLAAEAGDGYDVVVDVLWGETAAAALPALAFRGRFVQVGNSASPTAEVSSRGLRVKLAEILFYSDYSLPQEDKARSFARMCEHAARGELRVEVEELPLSEVASAWEQQRTSPHRKLLLRP